MSDMIDPKDQRIRIVGADPTDVEAVMTINGLGKVVLAGQIKFSRPGTWFDTDEYYNYYSDLPEQIEIQDIAHNFEHAPEQNVAVDWDYRRKCRIDEWLERFDRIEPRPRGLGRLDIERIFTDVHDFVKFDTTGTLSGDRAMCRLLVNDFLLTQGRTDLLLSHDYPHAPQPTKQDEDIDKSMSAAIYVISTAHPLLGDGNLASGLKHNWKGIGYNAFHRAVGQLEAIVSLYLEQQRG